MTYIAYRNDWPLFVTDSCDEMATYLGTTKRLLLSRISHRKKRKPKSWTCRNTIEIYAYDFQDKEDCNE